jgi:hypothetical protein
VGAHNAAEFKEALLKQYLDAEHAASRDFDRTVMTVAGGGLAFSLTLARDQAGHVGAVAQRYLVASWILLALSLIFILLSYTSSGHAIHAAILELTEGSDPMRERRGRAWNALTLVLNMVAVVSLLGGIVSLVLFAITCTWRMAT